jgi:DUF4097 and DUF4098 domain-containing protein YvlB
VKRATTILTALVLSLLPLAATAQQSSCENSSCATNERLYRDGRYFVLEIIGSLPAQPKLAAETDAGWIKILGGKQTDKIWFRVNKRVRANSEADAKRYFEEIRFRAYTSGGTVVLRGEPSQAGHNAMLEMEIQTPRNLDYAKASTRGGSVGIYNITGKAYAESMGGSVSMSDIGSTAVASTMGGSIDVDKIGGDLKLETAGGSINIGTVNGQVVAETAGGSINVAQGKNNVSVETAGGSISVAECAGMLKATTAGGSLDIGRVGRGANLETAGGSIRLVSAGDVVKAVTSGGGIKLSRLPKGVYAETEAGPIEAEFVAKRGDFTDSKLITNAGDIVVYLPSDLGVTVRATIEVSNGHRVVSDFDEVKVTNDNDGYGPRTVYGNGAINGGGPVLKLNTSNGNIYLRRTRR